MKGAELWVSERTPARGPMFVMPALSARSNVAPEGRQDRDVPRLAAPAHEAVIERAIAECPARTHEAVAQVLEHPLCTASPAVHVEDLAPVVLAVNVATIAWLVVASGSPRHGVTRVRLRDGLAHFPAHRRNDTRAVGP
jgi:hypothetical protein